MAVDLWSKIASRWTRPIDERKAKAEDSVVQHVIGQTGLPSGVLKDEYGDCDDDDDDDL